MTKELLAEIAYLRDADRQWHAIFDSLGSAVWLMDARMRVIYANPATRELFGVDPEAVLGRPCWEVVHGTDAPIPDCPIARAARSRRTESLELRIGGRWLAITGTPILDGAGEITGFVHRVDDVTERRRIEEEVRNEKEFSASLVGTAQAIILVLDPEGRVVWFNRFLEALSGRTLEETRGVDWFTTFLPERVRAETHALFARAVSGTQTRGNVDLLLARGGREIQVEWHDHTLEDADGRITGLLAIGIDVTARERAAAEARALLKATRAVVEEPEFGTAARRIFDVCREVTGAGAGYLTLLGADGARDEVVVIEPGGQSSAVDRETPFTISGLHAEARRSGKTIVENEFVTSAARSLLPPGHIEIENLLLAPMRVGGETFGILGLANRPGGFDKEDTRLAEAFGELLAIAHDRAVEARALAESEARYRLLAENVSDVIWTTDLSLTLTYISPSDERLSGYAAAESLGRRADRLLSPESARTVADALREELARDGAPGVDPKRTRRFELEQTTKLGAKTWIEINAGFVRDSSGRPIGVMGVSRDITEKRRMQASLAQADRLASMGLLAAGVAHEINNPLSFAMHNVESVVTELPPVLEGVARCRTAVEAEIGASARAVIPEELAEALRPEALADIVGRLREALTGIDRIKAIVRGLGTFSRLEKTDIRPIDVRQPVEHAVAMARNEIRYKARLAVDLRVTPPVLGSDGKIAQVVLNLLLNAAQAIDEGDVANNEIRVRTWSEGNEVRIEVADTGKGIRPDDLPRVFEPFFSTKPIGVGSGLGLPICREIVEEFGGRIELASEVGSGTRAVATLPVFREEPSPDSERPAPSSAPPELRGRILVVDDEPGVRRMVGRILGRSHEIVLADSGEAAQRILSEDSFFDVLIVDVMMPLMTGIDLHMWLKARDPRLADRVVFFTGGVFTPKAAEHLGGTANQKIEKTIGAQQLRKLVAGLVAAARGGAA